MEEFFEEGFTKNSYFNIYKTTVMQLYNDRHENSLKQGENYEMEFSFKVSEDINGCVEFYKNIDYITINTGTIAEIHKMFTLYMCNPNIYDHIGSTEKCKVIFSRNFKYSFDKNNKQLKFNYEINDDIRRRTHLILSVWSTRFIIEHELGHILNGHTKFARDKGFKFHMTTEDQNKKHDKDMALNIATCEMDADAFAITAIMASMLIMYEEYYIEDKHLVIKECIQNRKEIFRLCGFSFASLFFLLHRNYKLNKNNNDYMLEPLFRCIVNYGAGCNFIDEHVKNNPNTFKNITIDLIKKLFFKGMIDAQEAFNFIYNENLDFKTYLNQQEHSRQYNLYKEIKNTWKQLYNDLNIYARIKLYKDKE